MLSVLVLLLPTAYTLVVPGGNLADRVIHMEEECADIQNRVDNVIDKDSTFPAVVVQSHIKCKEDLNKLKQEYIGKYLLNQSFYNKDFPARLSNGTVIMINVPSNKESPTTPDPPSCASCESLCMVYEKCSTLLVDINQTTDQSEKSYYKMKYGDCVDLLNEQKQKYIEEHEDISHLGRESDYISVKCKLKTVRMPITPERRMKSNEKTEVNDQEPHKEIITGNKYKSSDETTNKDLNEYNINSITGREHVKDQSRSEAIKKVSTGDDLIKITTDRENNANEFSNFIKKDINRIYPSNAIDLMHIPEHSKDKETKNIQPKSSYEYTKRESTQLFGNVPKDRLQETVKVTDTMPDKEFISINDQRDKKAHGNGVMVTTSQESKNIAGTGAVIRGVYNSKLSSPKQMDALKKLTVIEEPLGDEINRQMIYCEGILKEANKGYQTLESVPAYDRRYAKCIKYLNTLKKKYAKRHGIQLKKYKSIFPIVLSSGEERLVDLPGNMLEVVQPQNVPHDQNLSISPTNLNSRKTIDLKSGGSSDDNGAISTDSPDSIKNPAFDSNVRNYEYFALMSNSKTFSTLAQFTTMIRQYSGQSERRNY